MAHKRRTSKDSPVSSPTTSSSPRMGLLLGMTNPIDAMPTNFIIQDFESARQIFQDIENYIQNELNETPLIAANYEQHQQRRTKSKRKRGPFQIIPKNQSKAPRTVGDMVYNPEEGRWEGNEESLRPFSSQVNLIRNFGRSDVRKEHGHMIYDPVEMKWKGNEKDGSLPSFEPRRPGLLKPIGGEKIATEIGGMRFDPVAMRWVGNEDVLASFGDEDNDGSFGSSKSDGFAVGNEYLLSPLLIQMFNECASKHKKATAGWFSHNKQDEVNTRSHLHVIRQMSIMRIVHDVKRQQHVLTLNNNNNNNNNTTDTKKLSMSMEEDVDDWSDVGPFPGGNTPAAATAKTSTPDGTTDGGGMVLKLKKLTDSEDADFDALDAEERESSKDEDQNNNNNNNNNNNKFVDEEKWDDFSDDLDKLSQQISSNVHKSKYYGSVNSKHPFALLKTDDPKRKSMKLITVDQLFNPNNNNNNNNNNSHTNDVNNNNNTRRMELTDEENEEGLVIPAGSPLQLKQNPPTHNGSADLDIEDLETGPNPTEKSSSGSGIANNVDEDDDHEEYAEPEEEWDDVDIPANGALGLPVTKKPSAIQQQQQTRSGVPQQLKSTNTAREEWDDFELPTGGPLVLKVGGSKASAKKKDDEWEDVDVSSLQAKLKEKFGKK